MPLKKPMSNVEVGFTALWTSSVFSFIVAPTLFPNVKFLRTGKWVLGFPFLVLVCHMWYSERKKTPLAYITQLSHITIRKTITNNRFHMGLSLGNGRDVITLLEIEKKWKGRHRWVE
ncbi:hypothetical protein Bca52824_030486 [Brassica carinata]|uniref:Uncharacterized protein n=1 Tax=Brassica carinata TaxID=52824 RepID=A0A8X7S8F2_BRACI|nr:hypothetical protein Bca52824_030486 [Brassica carinata]